MIHAPTIVGALLLLVTAGCASGPLKAGGAAASRRGDRDSDGVSDARDLCPAMAEDHDRFEDDDGCPDPDNDHDGIVDRKDACPNRSEIYNGHEDDDGCPDKGPVYSREIIEAIGARIYFARGSARVQALYLPILKDYAARLSRTNSIQAVEAIGHASADEPSGSPLALERARAVVRALRKFGVAGAIELRARSAGVRQRLSQDESCKEHDKDRRVELRVAKRRP